MKLFFDMAAMGSRRISPIFTGRLCTCYLAQTWDSSSSAWAAPRASPTARAGLGACRGGNAARRRHSRRGWPRRWQRGIADRGSAEIRRTVEPRDEDWLLRGGGHGRPAARDQAPRPQAAARSGRASETERAPEPRGGVGADARLGSGRLRQDDAAGRVAGAAPADGRSAAWLSLDQRDNDPALFWTYVVAALQTAAPGVGAGALSLLQSPPAADRGGPRHAAQRPRAPSRTMSCWCSTTTTSSTRARCRTGWPSCWSTCPRRSTW